MNLVGKFVQWTTRIDKILKWGLVTREGRALNK